MKIEYIGPKAKKVDNVAGTGMTWYGTGDVQEVPDAAGQKLIGHTDVWRRPIEIAHGLADGLQVQQAAAPAVAAVVPTPEPVSTAAPAQAPTPEQATQPEGGKSEPKFVLVKNENEPIVLDDMDDEALHAFAKAHGLKVHHARKGDSLRQAIVDAAEGKPEAKE